MGPSGHLFSQIKQNIYLQKIVLEIVQKSKAATAAVQGSQHLLALLEFEPLSH